MTSPTTRADFMYGLSGEVAVLVHRVEDAPMHGLQAVAHIRQRARHDHAHRVIEVAALHLVGDGNGTNVLPLAPRRQRAVFLSSSAKVGVR